MVGAKLRQLWRTSPELVGTALVMTVVLGGALVGLAADPPVITGAPAWLKPAKFAVSIAIYTLTLAWIFTYLPEWPRTRRVIGRLTAVVMVLEMSIIAGQTWRGTTSHFNFSTPLDGALFTIMGAAIMIQTLTSIAVAVALWRTKFQDPALGWALRLGMSITIIGALVGGLMTRPTPEQLAAARAGERMTIIGAHTVGAPDGGPGLPGTGWSTEHGDLRVPHFIGLHAVQALPFFALLLAARGVTRTTRVRLTLVAAASYAALFVVVTMQALRGVPIVPGDAADAAPLALWAAGTALGAFIAAWRPAPSQSTATV